MAKVKINLPFTSRYKKTRLYTSGGKTFFGIWNPPNIKLDGDEKVITIRAHQAGSLDKIAYEEYGDRALWWAIAYVNNIKNPPEEVVAGLELVIPKPDNIKEALLETENA